MPKTNNLTQFIHYRRLYGKSAPPPLIWQLRSQSPQALLRTLLTSEKATIVAFQNPDISGKLSFEEMIDVFAAHATLAQRVIENKDLFEKLSFFYLHYLKKLLAKNSFLAKKVFDGFYSYINELDDENDLDLFYHKFEIFYKDLSVYFNPEELEADSLGSLPDPSNLPTSIDFSTLQETDYQLNGLDLACLGYWNIVIANEIINTPALRDKITGNQWVIFGYPHVKIANQIIETPMLLNQVNAKGRAMLGQKHFAVGNKIFNRKKIYKEFSIQDFRILSGIDLDRKNYHNQIFSLENFPWDFQRKNRLDIIKKIFSCPRFKELLATNEALDFLDILCEHYTEVANFIFSEKSSLKNQFTLERQKEILNNHFIQNNPIEKTFPQWKNKPRAIPSSSLAFICRNHPNHAKAIYIALTNARLFNYADFEIFFAHHELAPTFLSKIQIVKFSKEFYKYPLINIKNMLKQIDGSSIPQSDNDTVMRLRELTSIWQAFQNICSSIEPKEVIEELPDEKLETVVEKEEIGTPRPGL